MFLTMTFSKRYLIHHNSTGFHWNVFKMSKTLHYTISSTMAVTKTYDSFDHHYSIHIWQNTLTYGGPILLLTMCLLNEWIHGKISKWFKKHCKLQRVTQMQTIAVCIQLKVGFMRLHVRSPEQAADAEGRVELGYNANSHWCPIHHIGMIHTISRTRLPLHSPTSSLTGYE